MYVIGGVCFKTFVGGKAICLWVTSILIIKS